MNTLSLFRNLCNKDKYGLPFEKQSSNNSLSYFLNDTPGYPREEKALPNYDI